MDNIVGETVYGSKLVGILGATGTIGKSLITILEENSVPILKGSRRFVNGSDTKSVNINDKQTLKTFVDACDIIINCTGPSLLTSQKILPAVIEAGKDYIDAFGWINNTNSLKPGVSRIILNAGSVPGMLGVLIKSMYKSGIQRMKVWSGGREDGSVGSVGDIILSSLKGYGDLNSFIENNRIVKGNMPDIDLYDEVNVLHHETSSQLILTSEILNVAKYLGIKNIENYIIWADECMKRLIMYGCMEASQLKDAEELNRLFSELVYKINYSNKTMQQPWFMIVIEAIGKYETQILKLSINDSSKVTALLLANMVDILFNQELNSGIYWPFELADSDRIIKSMERLGISMDVYGEL